MNNLSRTVLQISGQTQKECYIDFECALEVAMEVLPHYPTMRYVSAEVCRRLERTCLADSVERALNRAAEDIWYYGDRKKLEEIYCHPLPQPPTCKSMLITIGKYIKDLDETTILKQRFYYVDDTIPDKHNVLTK